MTGRVGAAPQGTAGARGVQSETGPAMKASQARMKMSLDFWVGDPGPAGPRRVGVPRSAGERGKGVRGGGGNRRPVGVSRVPGLRGGPEANLLSARGGASASCCMQSKATGKGRSGRHNLRNGVDPRSSACAHHSERRSRRKRQRAGKRLGRRWGQAVGTSRWSVSGVVCLVASRHRSTASLRAVATASLRRAAPLAPLSRSRRIGG